MPSHRAPDERAARSDRLGILARELLPEETKQLPIRRKADRRAQGRRWIVKRLWLRYVGEGPQRVRATVRDGHVLYPCGCMWNLSQQKYSVQCTRDDHRDVTPPHEDACLPRITQTDIQVPNAGPITSADASKT